ncbi:MAG: Undecaprenyl diphosphate synthase [Firmicutes bacterium]|nr:Undecaprenyl diphosphate synthase [Bacillota bacterium]MDI6704707.1 isoprenyl transferase [Bacillota bacterium]
MSIKRNDIRHVAVIMDGNGRWATERGLPRIQGHRAGVAALKEIIKYSGEIGLEYLTLYVFSTENWKRPSIEVNSLMGLLIEFVEKELEELKANGVKLMVIGDLESLPRNVRASLERAILATEKNKGLHLSVAVNYGGRDEIVRAVKRIADDAASGRIDAAQIDDRMIESYLYTAGIPDPDLVIRPSGELRISNFLLWQIAYSELWFSNCYWPDFTPEDFQRAIDDYYRRDRRYGGL